jgi:hypothetical protein
LPLVLLALALFGSAMVPAASAAPLAFGADVAPASPAPDRAAHRPLASQDSDAGSGQPCRFQLGFAALHDLLPDVIGSCVENEWHHALTGDALQRTTGGLLVWRKADNWTAFTDGARTWVNGPFGLQDRPNSTRLAWEANPENLPIVPPPAPGERCHTAGLGLGLVGTDAGAGNVVATIRFTSTLDVPCTLFGYVGAQLMAASGNPLPTSVVRAGGYFAGDPGPSNVVVPPHGSAIFRVHWGQVEVGDERECPVAHSLAVIPPDEYVAIVLPIQIRACGGGRLNVSAVLSETWPLTRVVGCPAA